MAHYFRKIWKGLDMHRRQAVHGFRSFVATFMLKDGTSIYDVKNLLGHSTTRQTEGYALEGRLMGETMKAVNNSISIPEFPS